MKIAATSSLNSRSLEAASEAVGGVQSLLGPKPPDLAFLFLSRHHAPQLEETVAKVARDLRPRHLLGSTGEGVICGKREYENGPALSLWAADLPGVEITSGQAFLDQTPDGAVFLGADSITDRPATMLLLGEPFSFDVEAFLPRLTEDHPQLQILGGMSSGARTPGENRLFLGGEVLVDGAVFAVVSGAVGVRPIVSQGCRPFGKRLVVTRAERNLVLEIGSRPVLEKLNEQLGELSKEEKALLERGLHIGLAVDACKEEHRRGDFLVRNVMGFVPEKGALLVADLVKPGTTVQFHLRDAATASDDLRFLLRQAVEEGCSPRGALLFSCNGRGSRLFSRPNHDAESVGQAFGDLPLAGFFAGGEIGPVGGRSFLHGFTASVALFEEKETGAGGASPSP